jgi:hypothetical protein
VAGAQLLSLSDPDSVISIISVSHAPAPWPMTTATLSGSSR